MLHVHDRLGDFEILHLLGKGGMGEVYEARQFNPERRVALKVLAPWLADDEDAYQRFKREAAVPANLDHPGIVRIITQGKTDSGVAYYAMHLVRGISLAEMIKRTSATPHSDVATKTVEAAATPSMEPPSTSVEAPPPSPNFAVESTPQLVKDYRTDRFTTLARIGIQVARALAYAHQQGHVHRDIKPSNVMVDHHDHVYLVDFGLTRALEAAAGSGTQIGVVIGTPWYMSPEQAEGKAVDARCDIYSLGLTLYELATQGLGPWTANRDDKHSVLAQVRAGQALPLRTLAPGIPPALEHIIVKAMNLRPQKRYASAAEMARELEAFLGVASKHTPPGSKSTSVTPNRHWPIWAAGGAVLATIIISISAIVYGNWNPVIPAPPPGPDVVKPNLDGSKAEPEFLRKATLRTQIPLMNENQVPIWPEKRLRGNGTFSYNSRDRLRLASPDITVYALTDPHRVDFTFEIELYQTWIREQQFMETDMGIVFGWDRSASDLNEFFIVKVDRNALGSDLFGRVTVGTGWIQEANANHQAGFQWLQPLPPGRDTIALPRIAPSLNVPLKLVVRGERVSLEVPDRPPLSFTMADLPPSRGGALTPSGTIGIWGKGSGAHFKNAKITLY